MSDSDMDNVILQEATKIKINEDDVMCQVTELKKPDGLTAQTG